MPSPAGHPHLKSGREQNSLERELQDRFRASSRFTFLALGRQSVRTGEKPIHFPSRSHRSFGSHKARTAGLPEPGRSPTTVQSPVLSSRACGGLQFPECPAATGGARERPQPIRGSAGAARALQVEPGRWAGAGCVPNRVPGSRSGCGVRRDRGRHAGGVPGDRT